MPYIGKLPFGNGRVFVATGYNKWGLSNGTVAALVIADAVAGRPNPWAETFDANRADVGASVKDFVKENLDVVARFAGDRIRHLTGRDPAELAPDEGAVVEAGGRRVGAYRDAEGRLHAVSLVCTHLGCHVNWNPRRALVGLPLPRLALRRRRSHPPRPDCPPPRPRFPRRRAPRR